MWMPRRWWTVKGKRWTESRRRERDVRRGAVTVRSTESEFAEVAYGPGVG